MASTIDKIKKDIIEAVNASQKKTSAYDTEAEVVRIDGDTAWVHIAGGVEETPVALTINAKKGDKVQVRVSNGKAWIMGNETAPPTDDAKANEADAKAVVAKEEAGVAKAEATVAKETADAVHGIAVQAQEDASEAMATANGKNTIYRSSTQPPSSGTYAVGDLWFDTANDNKIHRYDGTTWIEVVLGDDALDSISADKITAGTIDASEITVSNIDAGKITSGNLDAERIKANVVSAINATANKIDAKNIKVDEITIGQSQVTDLVSDLGSIEDTANAANNRAVAYRGVCSTAAATAAKVVTCANFSLVQGATITVYFTNANTYTAGGITLNVNGTGAKNVRYGVSGNTVNAARLMWDAGATLTFIYDGTQYRLADNIRTRSAHVGQSSNTTNVQNKPWYKFASVVAQGANIDYYATFRVECYPANDRTGILKVRVRTDGSSYISPSSCTMYWDSLSNAMATKLENFVLAYKPNTANSTVELWCKIDENWGSYNFTLLSESTRVQTDTMNWRLYYQSTDGGSADITSGYQKIKSTSKTAYITYINSEEGIKVHDASDTSNYARLNSNGMQVYHDNIEVASFGINGALIGQEEGSNIRITPELFSVETAENVVGLAVDTSSLSKQTKVTISRSYFGKPNKTETINFFPNYDDIPNGQQITAKFQTQYSRYTKSSAGNSVGLTEYSFVFNKGTDKSETISFNFIDGDHPTEAVIVTKNVTISYSATNKSITVVLPDYFHDSTSNVPVGQTYYYSNDFFMANGVRAFVTRHVPQFSFSGIIDFDGDIGLSVPAYDNANKIFYGTCSSRLTTGYIVNTSNSNFTLENNNVIYIYFSSLIYPETVSTVRLNIDGLGAIDAYYNGAPLNVNNGAWHAGEMVAFYYDGTYFQEFGKCDADRKDLLSALSSVEWLTEVIK